MTETPRERMQHYLDVVALGYEDRDLIIEPIISDTDKAPDGELKTLGIAFHQHTKVPIINEEGVSKQKVCDIVILDSVQILQLKRLLKGVTVHDKEGNSYDD